MSTIFGDQSDPSIPETLSGKQHGKNQTLTGIDNEANTLVGDVDTITDKAKGGNDDLTGGNNSNVSFLSNTLAGDAITMSGSARGGNDTLIGGDYSGSSNVIGTSSLVRNFLTGDAFDMSGSAHGGNDALIGGNNTGIGSSFSSSFFVVNNYLAGDVADGNMSDSARGGNDTLKALFRHWAAASYPRSSGGCNSTYWGAVFPARCGLAFPKFGFRALQSATIC